MNPVTLIILFVALAWVMMRKSSQSQPAWARHFLGWRQVFGFVGLLVALFIVMNPEFLALGVVMDAAFFDLLVLALGLQFQAQVRLGWRYIYRLVRAPFGIITRTFLRDWYLLCLTSAQIRELVHRAFHEIRKLRRIGCVA